MADAIGSTAGRMAGKAALKAFINPSLDIIKVVPQGIIELVLRGAAVTLALFALIAAAVCQGDISRHTIRPRSRVPGSSTNSACGWVIFLSFWVMLYQILAIVQLFVRVKILYKVIELITWSIFFLVDIIAIGIAAGGYFCGGLPMAVYAGQWGSFSGMNGTARVQSSASATSAFSFLSLFLFLGMLGYFFAARYVLKWPTHGEKPPSQGYEQTDDVVDD